MIDFYKALKKNGIEHILEDARNSIFEFKKKKCCKNGKSRDFQRKRLRRRFQTANSRPKREVAHGTQIHCFCVIVIISTVAKYKSYLLNSHCIA